MFWWAKIVYVLIEKTDSFIDPRSLANHWHEKALSTKSLNTKLRMAPVNLCVVLKYNKIKKLHAYTQKRWKL